MSAAAAKVELGYSLSCEEFPPADLIRNARAAEEAGFGFAMISDHFHPWTSGQGQSPFVWSVVGAIAQTTEHIRLGTGVTCPLVRTHPAIVAHAAATSAVMMPGRFMLGLGTGERLNEHVTGGYWPSPDERVEMLEEAIDLMRRLMEEGTHTVRGRHYRLDHARLFTLPDEPPPFLVAANASAAAELAGRAGDGLISTAPSEETVRTFVEAGGEGKPRYGQLTVCWAEDEDEARRTAHRIWPNAAIGGGLSQELATPDHFEAAAQTVREEDVAETVVCGPDRDRHLEGIAEFARAGFDHVFVHQVGPDQEGFLRFYAEEVLPSLDRVAAGVR